MNRIWSEAEKQFVAANAGVLSDKDGAAKLSQKSGRNITVHAYRKQRQRLQLKKRPGRGVCGLAHTIPNTVLPPVTPDEAARE